MNNVKLIQFSDGTYGIRKGFIFYNYLSLALNWYDDRKDINKYCKFLSKADALYSYNIVTKDPRDHKVVSTL